MKRKKSDSLANRDISDAIRIMVNVEPEIADEPKSLFTSIVGDLDADSRQDDVIGEVAREVDRQDKCMADMYGKDLVAASKQRAATLQILYVLLGKRERQIEKIVDDTLLSVMMNTRAIMNNTAIKMGVEPEFMCITRETCQPQLDELIEQARRILKYALKKG